MDMLVRTYTCIVSRYFNKQELLNALRITSDTLNSDKEPLGKPASNIFLSFSFRHR